MYNPPFSNPGFYSSSSFFVHTDAPADEPVAMDEKPRDIRRTRSGCWGCKKRRRRCSEERPACSRCRERGLECHYGIRLLWEDEADAMGIAFGRSSEKTRDGLKKYRYQNSHYMLPTAPQAARFWLNTTSHDIRLLYQECEEPERPLSRRGYQNIPIYDANSMFIPHSLSEIPYLADTDSFLFGYFINNCVLWRSLVDSKNPWRSVLLPMCFQSKGLLYIAIAWAAHSLGNKCNGPEVSRYDRLILLNKYRSLKYLQQVVPQPLNDQTAALPGTRCDRDALLLLMMFHCLLEIASGSTSEWTYHMKGAILVMKHYASYYFASRDMIFSEEVLRLVHTFFIEKDTFLRTTTIFASDKQAKILDNFQWSTEVPLIFPFLDSRHCMEVDPCMGLSPELLDVISCISEQAQILLVPNHSGIDHRIFESLKDRLRRLESIPEIPGTDKLMELNSIAFQEATWIYLYHIVGKQPRQGHIIQQVHLPKLLSTLESIHKAQGKLLCFMPYPMWALFIASCVISEEKRVKILEFFALLKQRKPISNVPSTMLAVEAIWKRRDLVPEACGHSLEYPTIWGDVISQLGWKMPLT